MRRLEDIQIYERIPILVRAALNVPTHDGAITNEYRLRRALPTLRFLSTRGARVVLVSHLGSRGTETLAPVAASLGRLIPQVSFCAETIGPRVRDVVRMMHPGDVVVLENLRRRRGEIDNDTTFAAELAMLADLFVQDSFDTCHRTHASIVGVPTLLPSYAGLLLAEEVDALSGALTPTVPALAVIGGLKFATKEPVLTALLAKYDRIFVGGALANDFLKAQGHEVGKSLVSVSDTASIASLLAHPKIVLPTDAVVAPAALFGTPELRAHTRIVSIDAIGKEDMILDHGPSTSVVLQELVRGSRTVLWNGPLGAYEQGFVEATDALARSIAAAPVHSVVGGGDTIASIEKLGLFSRFSFVSTGGGAMLEFLAKGTLPGIAALG